MSGEPRVEIKFLLSPEAYLHLRSVLSSYGERDPHSQGNEKYPVFSSYYDSSDLVYFHDKINGEYDHVKVRVRRYTDDFNDGSTGFLEAKIKYDKWQKKIRIEERDAERLENPERWDEMGDRAAFFIAEHAEKGLLPTCNVFYEREAFSWVDEDGPVRYNFDTNIIVLTARERCVTRLLAEKRQVLFGHAAVFEVKMSRERLPPFLEKALKQVRARQTRFSKYCAGMILLDEMHGLGEVRV